MQLPRDTEKKLEALCTILFGGIILSTVFGSGDFIDSIVSFLKESTFSFEGYRIKLKYFYAFIGVFCIWIGLNGK